MDRTFESAAAASPPSPPASPSAGYPTAGNPALAIPATKPGPWWYHMVTEEIRNVIAAAGLTPDHTDVTQLRQAIQAMLVANQKAVIIDNAVFEASVADGEVVRWDASNGRFDEAIADGSANNRAVGIADVTNSRVYLYGECPLFSGLTPGSRYYLDASTAGAITATAPADAVQIGIAKSATVLWVDVDAYVQPTVAFPAGYISGCTLSNNGTNPNTQIDFAAGRARDSSNAFNMVLATMMTKTLQASGAWAAGNNQNGLFSGARASNTWYHCFLIRKIADGSIDCGFDTSIAADNIPSGYDAYRLLGSVKTDSSGNIIGFLQFKDEFWWKSAIVDVSTSALGTASTTYSISVPPGRAVVADLMVYGGATDANIVIRGLDQTDVAPAATSSIPSAAPATIANIASLVDTGSGTHVRVLTNNNCQIAARSSSSGSNFHLWTRGWRDSI